MPCVPCLARLATLGLHRDPGATRPWWAGELVTRLTRPETGTLVPVLGMVALALVTGWWVLDPLMATLVAVNILWSGWKVIAQSLSGLMDEAVPDEDLTRIREVISEHGGGAVEAHDLRTRHAGRATFIEFHLVVPGEMSVFDAHEICDRLEAALQRAIDGAQVTIHVEPEHKCKHSGIVVLD